MRIIICLSLLLAAAIVHTASGQRPPAPDLRVAALKINVDDMDRALDFYAAKIGFQVADRSRYPAAVELRTDDNFRLILNRVSRLRQYDPANTGAGLTLQVNDLDTAIARMKALDIVLAETVPRKEGVGNAISIKDHLGRNISMMHQTIVKVDPFREPRVYNFGLLVPNMAIARGFYEGKLGLVPRSEKYLPLDMPLGYPDKAFAFMLHYRPGVIPIKGRHGSSFLTIVFETSDLDKTISSLKKNGVKIFSPEKGLVAFEDPFGNISELVSRGKGAN